MNNFRKFFNEPEARETVNPLEVKVDDPLPFGVPVAVLCLERLIVQVIERTAGWPDRRTSLEGIRSLLDVVVRGKAFLSQDFIDRQATGATKRTCAALIFRKEDRDHGLFIAMYTVKHVLTILSEEDETLTGISFRFSEIMIFVMFSPGRRDRIKAGTICEDSFKRFVLSQGSLSAGEVTGLSHADPVRE